MNTLRRGGMALFFLPFITNSGGSGRNPITGKATTIEVDGDNNAYEHTPEVDSDDDRTKKMIGAVWNVYGGETGIQLSARTHQPGTPWDKARKNAAGRRNTHIHDDDIKKHYASLAEENVGRHTEKGPDG